LESEHIILGLLDGCHGTAQQLRDSTTQFFLHASEIAARQLGAQHPRSADCISPQWPMQRQPRGAIFLGHRRRYHSSFLGILETTICVHLDGLMVMVYTTCTHTDLMYSFQTAE
jgi:hypothetical protein